MKKNKDKLLTFRITEKTRALFKEYAKKRGLTMSEILSEWVLSAVKEAPGPPGRSNR